MHNNTKLMHYLVDSNFEDRNSKQVEQWQDAKRSISEHEGNNPLIFFTVKYDVTQKHYTYAEDQEMDARC